MRRDFLSFRRVAFIGAGGKTTLSEGLAHLAGPRTALLTTTQFYRPSTLPLLADPDENSILRAWESSDAIAVCGGTGQKCGAPSPDILSFLNREAEHLFIEADGARGLLLKIHEPHEPVIPDFCDLVCCVMRIDAISRPLFEVCHRVRDIEAVLGKDPSTPATCSDVARLILRAERGHAPFLAVLNRADREDRARAVASLLDCPCLSIPTVSDPESEVPKQFLSEFPCKLFRF